MEIIQKRAWVEIDLDAAAHNLAVIRERLGEKTKLCCVIKADAYGHGAVRLAKEYEALGADWLALSNIEEAMQIRRAGVMLPMLILGYTPPQAAALLAENNISQCAYSLSYCRLLSEYAQKSGVCVKIHIKIDTGMGRFGFLPEQIEEIASLFALEGLEVSGIFSHLHSAFLPNETAKEQLASFETVTTALAEKGIALPMRHIANSTAAVKGGYTLDAVRAGSALIGRLPIATDLPLKPAGRFEAEVLAVVLDGGR